MDLHHSFTVPADAETAWATLMDLEGVAGCFPGAAVTSVEDDSFTGTVKIKLGPIALVYAGSGTFVERDDAAHRAVIDAKGKDKRGNGTAGASVTLLVTDVPSGGSEVDVTTDLNVTGKPAQFGRGVMQDVSDKLLGQFVACLEKRFTAPEADEHEAESASTPASAQASIETPSAPESGSPAPAAPTTAGPAAAAAPRAAPRRAPAPAADSDDALDLGSAVLPVILRSYAPQLVVGVVGLVVGIVIGSRLRRR
ncbi:MAG: SRPBCC family protein [Lapillicoccus sp.]